MKLQALARLETTEVRALTLKDIAKDSKGIKPESMERARKAFKAYRSGGRLDDAYDLGYAFNAFSSQEKNLLSKANDRFRNADLGTGKGPEKIRKEMEDAIGARFQVDLPKMNDDEFWHFVDGLTK